MFDADGELTERLGVTGDTVLNALPSIRNGDHEEQSTGLYGVGTQVYDPIAGRYINQAAAATDPNPYRYDNGDPINGSSFDWKGAYGYGVWDTLLFGHFDDVFQTGGAASYARQNGWYYGGMATAVVGQILTGNLAAGAVSSTANIGRVAYGAARAYQAYAVMGDVVGVYDSYQGMSNGDFSPLNLLGFAPTIGWASRGIAGMRALESISSVPNITLRLSDQLNPANYRLRRALYQFPTIPVEYIGPKGIVFPEWTIGGSITQALPDGSYPRWFSTVASEKMHTIQGRYWMNRAVAQTNEFSIRQLRDMSKGFAPQVKVQVKEIKTGMIVEKWISKELHHNLGNRGFPGFDEPLHLREVWPWQHEILDSSRRTGYQVLKMLD